LGFVEEEDDQEEISQVLDSSEKLKNFKIKKLGRESKVEKEK